MGRKDLIIVIGWFLAAAATAGAVELANPSFETPTVADGGSTAGAPAGWSGSGGVYVTNPAAGAALQPTDGVNYLWLQSGSPYVKQWLGPIEPDTVYTVTLDVGTDTSFNWYQCGFAWYSGTQAAPVWGDWIVKTNHMDQWPTTNGWITVRLEFNSFNHPDLVGKLLRLELGAGEAAYDNLQYEDRPPWDGTWNGSFEYDVVADGAANTEDYPAGWNAGGGMEMRNPAAGALLQPSQGDNALWVTNGFAEAYAPGAIRPGSTYTVQVDAGVDSTMPLSWYEVALRYHDGATWHTIATANQVTDGLYINAWRTLTFQFNTDWPAYQAAVGEQLRIQLNGQGVVYDDVRLTVAANRVGGPQTFYVSAGQGSDSYDGLSPATPWRTFNHLNTMTLIPGDTVCLRRGDVWAQELHLWGKGTPGNEIELTAYGTGPRPRIIRSDKLADRCVVIEGPSSWRISQLDCRHAKTGIYLRYAHDPGNDDVQVDDCYFQDLDDMSSWDPALTDYELSFATAIMVGGKIWRPHDYVPLIDNLQVTNCGMQNCTVGFLCNWYYPPVYRNRARNLVIEDCWITGSVGLLNLFHVNGGYARRCRACGGHDGFLPLGTTAGIIQSSQNFTIDNCLFATASRQGGGADGCAFDFEGDTRDVTFSNNVCFGCDGQSLLVLNTGGPHVNLTIEHCTFFDNCRDALHWDGMNYELVTWADNNQGTLRNLGFYRAGSYGLYSDVGDFGNFTKSSIRNYNWSSVRDRPTVWEFDVDGDLAYWTGFHHWSSATVSGGVLHGYSTGGDPYAYAPATWVLAATQPIWQVRLMQTSGGLAQVYFITETDGNWTESKSVTFPVTPDGAYHDYAIDMTQCPEYRGVIVGMRLDPTTVVGAEFGVDAVRLVQGVSPWQRRSAYPGSYAVVQGGYLSGDVAKLRQREIMYHNPNDTLAVAPTFSGGAARATVDFNFVSPLADPHTLDLTATTQASNTGPSGAVQLSLFNHATAQWDLVGSFAASASEADHVVTIDAGAAAYVGPGAAVNARVAVSDPSYTLNRVDFQYVKVLCSAYTTRTGDVDGDGDVDAADAHAVTRQWLGQNCNCDNSFAWGADRNQDGVVDLPDYGMVVGDRP